MTAEVTREPFRGIGAMQSTPWMTGGESAATHRSEGMATAAIGDLHQRRGKPEPWTGAQETPLITRLVRSLASLRWCI